MLERWMVSFRGTYWLSSIYFILLRVFRFFLFLSLFPSFFASSNSFWGIEVSLAILKIKQWSYPRLLSGLSRGKLLQPYLVSNAAVLVRLGDNLNYIIPPLVSSNYMLQSIFLKLIYQFLYLIYGYLFFRLLEKVFEKERNRNKERHSRGVTTS